MQQLRSLVLTSKDEKSKYDLKTYRIAKSRVIHCDVVEVKSGKIIHSEEDTVPRMSLIVRVATELNLV